MELLGVGFVILFLVARNSSAFCARFWTQIVLKILGQPYAVARPTDLLASLFLRCSLFQLGM